MARLILLAIVAYYLSFIVGPLVIEPIMRMLGVSRSTMGEAFGIEITIYSIPYRIFLTVMTWVFLAYSHIPFGFIRPRVAMFSDTKALRYLQSLFFLAICGFIPVFLYLGMTLNFEFLRPLERSGFWFFAIGVIVFCAGGSFVLILSAKLFETEFFSGYLRFLDQSRLGYGGAGRFTGIPEELKQNFHGFDEKHYSIFLGRSLFIPYLKIGMHDERHMLTIAGTRGGKGVSAIIPNLLLWKGSAIIIDPKGTNAEVTAKHRNIRLKQKVTVIDPFGVTSQSSVGFNPLQQLDINAPDARERVELIADALVVDEGERDQHWNQTARQILAGFITHLMTDVLYIGRRNLPEIRSMLRLSGEERIELLADMSVNDAAGFLAADAASRIINMGDSNELKSILSSVEKHTEWLSSPAMERCLSVSSDFNFQSMKENAETVYLVIPPQYLKTHARFLRLFINLTIRGFVDGGKAKIPAMFMMDEFLSLGHMKEVENAMSWVAGYNLFLWPFIQDFGSFKEIYGSKVNAFLGNTRAVQVFAVDDEETNAFVSERLGKKPLTNLLEIAKSNEVLPVREPSEVPLDISAESGRQYILQAGKPTMLIERQPYYKAIIFQGMFDSDPDHKGSKSLGVWDYMS